jgi:hypothetical protein
MYVNQYQRAKKNVYHGRPGEGRRRGGRRTRREGSGRWIGRRKRGEKSRRPRKAKWPSQTITLVILWVLRWWILVWCREEVKGRLGRGLQEVMRLQVVGRRPMAVRRRRMSWARSCRIRQWTGGGRRRRRRKSWPGCL